ncbi:MAG TPA: hypothetical protein VMZ03_02220, partial [Chitinophagaceae bacterium]|nr:hypothetical protein [Chitinophagaceae bacterium]
MQPKFTQRNLWSLCAKGVTMVIFFVAFSQVSFAQERPSPKKVMTRTAEERAAEERKVLTADNDAGIIISKQTQQQRENPQAICTTWTGVVDAADAATSLRAFRDGVPKTCAAPGTCAAGIAGAFQYEQLTWVNPVNAVQCVTVNFTCTSGGFGFVTAHNGSVNIANLCTNWIGDPGSSATVGQTITFSINAPALATIIFHMTNLGTSSGYQITVDAPLCTPPAPCSGTPNPGNTIASVTNACPAVPVNLSLQNATPGSGVTYAWERSTTAAAGPYVAFGTNSPNQSVTQTQQTWYRARVTCTVSGNSGTSTPVQVNQNPFSSCYCNSVAASVDDEEIFNVTFGSLNNTSNCTTLAPGPGSIVRRYGNYTTLPASNVVTGNVPISVTIGTCGGNFGNATG